MEKSIYLRCSTTAGMPIKMTYIGSISKIKDAAAKANEILSNPKLYEMIRQRTEPFDQTVPANLSPAQVADRLEASTEQPYVRECKTIPGVCGRFAIRFPRVFWLNLNAIGRCTVDSLAALMIHQCVLIASYSAQDVSFAYTIGVLEPDYDSAPYWIQQLVRQHFCQIPKDHLTLEYLQVVDIRQLSPMPPGTA